MAITALILFGVYFTVAFGIRTWMQYRQTGDTGFRGISGRVGSLEWIGGVLFVVALIAAVAAPILDLVGLAPVDALVARPIQTSGVVLTLIGIAATFAAQVTMGNNWRIGVDDNESTDLVTTGAFALARNPIFTAMVVTGLGLVLVVPNVVAIAGLIGLLLALQLQVRLLEEPYLARTHGESWAAYASKVGRFLPGLGTIKPGKSSDLAGKR